jgi:hypothetical protein
MRRKGAGMSRSATLTTTGKSNGPGLVLAFREAGSFWVELDLFNDFVSQLSDDDFFHIDGGSILLS